MSPTSPWILMPAAIASGADLRAVLSSACPAPVVTVGATAGPGPLGDGPFDPLAMAGAVGALLFAGGFATLRRAMAQSLAERVLAKASSDAQRERMRPLLERIDTLSTSASVLETACSLLFAVLTLSALSGSEAVSWPRILGVLAFCVPVLWFVTEAVARAVALRAGDQLLLRALPPFDALQMPLAALAWAFEVSRRSLLRLLGLRTDTESTRQIVAGLREVIEGTEISGRLDETERQIIGNVMEFRDVDVAAVMTPRTRVQAVDAGESLLAAAQVCADSGHSRIPVYEGTLDTIIGTVSARDLVQAMAAGRLERARLSELLHSAYFVPETKRISELLAELRREKIKMAIVLDEYGGTAGLVTVGDILSEIVGELPDEYDLDEPSPVRHMPGGAAEIDASLHVSEVNEALDLDIPEEADYETLGGFVLAELGHFPQKGESFVHGKSEFSVVEANDRRVLKVRVRRREPARAGA